MSGDSEKHSRSVGPQFTADVEASTSTAAAACISHVRQRFMAHRRIVRHAHRLVYANGHISNNKEATTKDRKNNVVFASWLQCLAMLGTKNLKRSQKCLGRASHDANIFLQGSSWPDKLLSALSRTIFFKMAHTKHSPLNILKISIFVFAHQPPRAYRKICKHASPINQNVYPLVI